LAGGLVVCLFVCFFESIIKFPKKKKKKKKKEGEGKAGKVCIEIRD